jgi:hypothetical protein
MSHVDDQLARNGASQGSVDPKGRWKAQRRVRLSAPSSPSSAASPVRRSGQSLSTTIPNFQSMIA